MKPGLKTGAGQVERRLGSLKIFFLPRQPRGPRSKTSLTSFFFFLTSSYIRRHRADSLSPLSRDSSSQLPRLPLQQQQPSAPQSTLLLELSISTHSWRLRSIALLPSSSSSPRSSSALSRSAVYAFDFSLPACYTISATTRTLKLPLFLVLVVDDGRPSIEPPPTIATSESPPTSGEPDSDGQLSSWQCSTWWINRSLRFGSRSTRAPRRVPFRHRRLSDVSRRRNGRRNDGRDHGAGHVRIEALLVS